MTCRRSLLIPAAFRGFPGGGLFLLRKTARHHRVLLEIRIPPMYTLTNNRTAGESRAGLMEARRI